MISANTVEQVKAKMNVVEVVGEFVSLKKNGSDFISCCPFHSEKTPSFKVNKAKEIYKCFGCGKSGDAISFLIEYKNMDYVTAIKHIANKYGIEVEENNKTYSKPVARLEKISPKMIKWFEDRGISNNTLIRFNITQSKEYMPQVGSERNCICFNYYKKGELVNIKFRCEG